jgi:hypothetical protein
MFIGRPQIVDDLSVHTVEQDWRRPNQRVMGSGKTENAMGTSRITRNAGRQFRGALVTVETKLDTRRRLVVMCGVRKCANGDQ